MKFSEKLKNARREKKMTQEELSREIGVSVRTVRNYEAGRSYPKSREIYAKLRDVFSVDMDYFLSEGDSVKFSNTSVYSTEDGKYARELISAAKSLFAGGELGEDDKKAVFDALQEAYFEAALKKK